MPLARDREIPPRSANAAAPSLTPRRETVLPQFVVMTDAMWAVLLGVVSVSWYLVQIAVSTAFFFETGGPPLSPMVVWGTVGVLALQAVPIVFRKRRPVLSFWLVFAGFLGCVLLTVDRSFTVSATLLFSVFTLTAFLPVRSWAITLSVAAAVDMIVHIVFGSVRVGVPPTFYVVAVILIRGLPVYAAPILAGLLYSTQRRREELATENARVLQENARALSLAQEAQFAAAVTSERNAMARELHDLSAHHLSGMLIQATGAQKVVRTKPDVAEELLDNIRTQATQTLQNLRAVVLSLRVDDEQPDRAVASPTLSSLPELIDSVRVLHPALNLHVAGDIDDLSPAISLACYRIIQESLTNARQHASGAHVRIDVRRRLHKVHLEVVNAPPSDSAVGSNRAGHRGYGVVGMRERATMLGGTFDASPTEEGGWRIRAVIPTDRQGSLK